MAGRFVFHKFSSGVARSTSFLGPRASASAARVGAPDCGTRNISNVLHGAAPRLGMAFPNNHGIHAFASVTRSKRGLSSTASNKYEPSGKAKRAARVHDFTPSVILNSLATLFMGLGLVSMMKDN